MALTGLDIFKKLPKTNCGECGVPTCLAFAMKLASKQAELDACPYVSDEVKEELSEAAAPPIRTVEVGFGENAFKVGGEVVMYRHEKTFFNPCGFALLIEDSASGEEIEKKLSQVKSSQFERIGQILKADLIAVKYSSGDENRYLSLVNKAKDLNFPLILICSDEGVLKKSLEATKGTRPLIYAAQERNVDSMASLALEYQVPLAVKADSLDNLSSLTEALKSKGVKDIVLDPGSRSLKKTFENLIFIRRAAIEKKVRSLGFPAITFPNEEVSDDYFEVAYAAGYVVKYGGIVVLNDLSPEKVLPLFVLRQNIYTDPQRPMQVEEKIYEFASPDENSPFLVTTNFSLTYFIVSGEIESSKIPTWLGVVNTEGLSVLTAWSAGKFTSEKIASFVKGKSIAERINHKKIVIPGYVAILKGELEDELPGFEIIVGPREAGDIPAFLREWKT